MSGHFKFKNKIELSKMTETDVIPESDYATLTPDGFLVQLDYVEKEKEFKAFEVKPGIYSILKTMTGYDLKPTTFVQDKILENLLSTKEIEDAVNVFFENLDLYKEFGVEIPKRGALFCGPAGSGKTTALNKLLMQYGNDGKTLVVVWHTSKYEASEVQDFIKCFKYIGVERLILVCEDLGGMENEQTRMRSDSSLLSLLDNQEKTFSIPVFIAATTNYPENFAENLTNRPGRFDDIIQTKYPDADMRAKLLEFFVPEQFRTPEAMELIRSKKCDKFTPAHIRKVYQDSRLKKKPLHTSIDEVVQNINKFNKGFSDQKGVGF